MKVTSIVARYSSILPLFTLAFSSITCRPVIPRNVLFARARPSWTAASKLVGEAAVNFDRLPTRRYAVRQVSCQCAPPVAGTVTSGHDSRRLLSRSTNDTASIAAENSICARLIRRCDPNRTVGYRILVHVERLQDSHGLVALLAVPERPHIVSTFPLRDRISRIGIILVPK